MKRHAFNAILALAVSLAGAPFASRAGAIQGTVRDAVTLAALRGIWVNVFQGPNPDHAGDEDWEWVGASETDTDGHYEIAGLPARHYNVQANDGRAGSGHPYIGDGLYNVSVAEGATTTVDFALRRAGMLYGFVRDAETDAAVPGVQILVEMPFVEDGAGWHTALTDANGFYEVFLAPTVDALYPVRVANAPKPGTDQSYAAQIAPGLYAASEATTRGPDFALVTGGTLRGRLTTADGTPVPGISAGDALVWTPGGLIDAMATPTDADGVFRIDGLPAGVDVWFETNDSILAEANGKTYAHGERLVGPFRVAAGDVQDMPSLYLPEAGSARLTVRDTGGDPLEGARVWLAGFDIFGGWIELDEDEVATDAAGQASYAGLPPGRYQAAAIGEGGVPVVSEEFVVASGIEAQPAVAMPTVGGTGTLTGNLANFAAVAPKNAEGAILPYTIGDYDGRHLAFGLSVLC